MLKMTLILQVSSQEPSTSSKSHPSFLSQIMLELDNNFRIYPISAINMIYDVKDDPLLQVSNQEPSTSSQVPNLSFLGQIMSDLDQTFRIGPLATTHIIFNV